MDSRSRPMREGLSFDDVVLVPRYSEVVPAEVNLATHFSRSIALSVPLSSAAMDTVTDATLAIALARAGGIGVIHKNLSIAEQVEEVKKVKVEKLLVAAAVGATGDYLDRAEELAKAGADAIVIDTAHGFTKRVIDAVKALKKKLVVDVISGNVGTADGARALVAAGADAVKVGMGPGSICTTRVVTGCGVPQLTAVMDTARAVKGRVPVIADGGIKYSGDIVKALAAGADSVMLGSLFAGTDESPGELVTDGGRAYKRYRGMGSVGAMADGSKDRYGQEGVSEAKFVPEGVEGRVPHQGPLAAVVEQLVGGVRSGFGYCGARDIATLHKNAEFLKVSPAGLMESHVHDVTMTEDTPNYRLER